jgi:hypothetical protein
MALQGFFYFHVHKNLSIIPKLSQINPIQVITPYLHNFPWKISPLLPAPSIDVFLSGFVAVVV